VKLKPIPAAVVDSSPIMSIFERRSSSEAFMQGLSKSERLYMSSGTLMELSIIFIGKKELAGTRPLDDLLLNFNIEITSFDLSLVAFGRQACSSYGKGHNSAGLNMGDLFSYSLAKSLNIPLFFEGLDFHQTDIQDAMKILGYSFDDKHSPVSIH
jgi:ribonuclease VapC